MDSPEEVAWHDYLGSIDFMTMVDEPVFERLKMAFVEGWRQRDQLCSSNKQWAESSLGGTVSVLWGSTPMAQD